jgi:hypothetical protein
VDLQTVNRYVCMYVCMWKTRLVVSGLRDGVYVATVRWCFSVVMNNNNICVVAVLFLSVSLRLYIFVNIS